MTQGRCLLKFFLISKDGWMDRWMEKRAKVETDMEDNRKNRYQ